MHSRNRFLAATSSLAAGAIALAASGTPAAAATCDEVAMMALPEGEITSAVVVPAGGLELPGQGGQMRQITDAPEFCRIAATLRPSPESNIQMELWLPTEGWNRRYVAVGNGGFAGSIGFNAMLTPLRRGYAVSSTDTGHVGGSGEFALNEELATDFSYRAIHGMAETSKDLVEAFYEIAPDYALFTGCSTGGRQAFMEAQRFPDDFDGIVAGAPAAYTTNLHAQQIWVGLLDDRTEGGALPEEARTLLNNAVLEQCDAIDGVADGVIENPEACSFDPASLQCADGQSGASCLTPAQVSVAASMYAGPRLADGTMVFPGFAAGSETGWNALMDNPLGVAVGHYQYFAFKDPDWDVQSFDLDRDLAAAQELIGDMNVYDPDLSDFVEGGGKLLIYHGWSDPGITPYSTVNYYQAVQETMGPDADDSVRLFMVPGMGHCGGGTGTSTFDMLAAIDEWVTSGMAPDSIPASRVVEGETVRTRPLCPYPQQAVYSGSGSTDDAANFTCEVVE